MGIKPAEYKRLEAEEVFPTADVWDRMCELFGWPQTFVGSVRPAQG